MNYNITDADKLKLQSLISANNVENQTPLIRQLKHSELIRTDVQKLVKILKTKKTFKSSNEFEAKCVKDCQFLFSNYTDIYNKVLKNELDLKILDNFLKALKDIEDGNLDQHEASVKIGMYLKELYVDSALKKTEKNDKLNSKTQNIQSNENSSLNISWKDFKNLKLNQ